MRKNATSGDYWNLISVCDEYVQMANDQAIENGYIDDDYDDEDMYFDEEDGEIDLDDDEDY